MPTSLKLPLDKEPFGHCIHQASPEEGSFQLPLSSFSKDASQCQKITLYVSQIMKPVLEKPVLHVFFPLVRLMILHFGQQGNHTFQFESMPLKHATSYNIFFFFTENISFTEGRRALAESAGGVLWSVMNKMKLRSDLDYSTFSKLL